MATTPFLSGLSVLEMGDGVGGAVASATLGLLGAEVTKVLVGPSRLARHRPWLERDGGPRVPLLQTTLDRSKDVIAADDPALPELLRNAHIVLDDQGGGIPDPEGYRRGVRDKSSRVWVSISPYGLTGPKATRPGGELVAEASGGLLATIEPVGGGRPTSPPGFLALRAVGQVAALAALHGLDLHRGNRRPVHIDVSSQEAVVFTGVLPECAHLLFRCPGRAGSGRYVAPSGLFPCRDGLVRIAAIEDHQWKGMVKCLGAPEWTEGLEVRAARAEHASMITERIRDWTASQLKAECADFLQRNGVPSTPVNGPSELLDSVQFSSRGFLVSDDADGVSVKIPGAPWVATVPGEPSREGTPDGDREPRLAGLRVTELTHVLAGPIVGSLLGAMGAEVVRLEDQSRLDIYRRTGPFAGGTAGVERGAYFAVANFSKLSVAAEPEEMAVVVPRLIGRSDVVIENVGLSRLDRLRIPEVLSGRDDVLVMHVSGFGTSGPLADYRVYANNVQAYGGLAYLTRDTEGQPAHLGTVLADPLSSVVAATVIAAWALGPYRGRGVDVDLSMAEVVATLLGEYVAEASLVDGSPPPSGTTLHPFAPHTVFECRDGRWLALAVESDADWVRLVEVLGQPPELTSGDWNDESARWNDRVAIEEILAERFSGWEADELDQLLASAGLRTAVVNRAVDLVSDGHLDQRGFFPPVVHPDPELVDARIVGMPWRVAGEGPLLQTGPPRLGNANSRFNLDGADQ